MIRKFLNTRTGTRITAVQWQIDNIKEVAAFCLAENVYIDSKDNELLWVNVGGVFAETGPGDIISWNGELLWVFPLAFVKNGTYVDITGIKV